MTHHPLHVEKDPLVSMLRRTHRPNQDGHGRMMLVEHKRVRIFGRPKHGNAVRHYKQELTDLRVTIYSEHLKILSVFLRNLSSCKTKYCVEGLNCKNPKHRHCTYCESFIDGDECWSCRLESQWDMSDSETESESESESDA